MCKAIRSIALFLSIFFLSSNAVSQAPIRIMPLGDSITYGAGAAGGYRLPLYVALTNADYNVDYVGTSTGNSDPGLGTEINHEGHGGWRITNPVNGLYDYIYSWFEQIEDPHVILLHIGTNDSYGFDESLEDINNLDLLVTRLVECQPSAEIIVTTLMKRGEPQYTYITNYFNPYVYPLVTNHVAQGHNVHYLDMHAYLELSDMPDNLHPDAGGYQKMADAWFPAITNIIGTNVTANLPAPIRGLGTSDNRTSATISFNKAVSPDTATNTANYAVNNGLTVNSIAIDTSHRVVTLITSEQAADTTYTVTMNNIEDETTPTALSIPTDSSVTFDSPDYPALVSASGSTDFMSVDIVFSKAMSPASATNIANYAIDNGLSVTSASISGDHLTVTLTTSAQIPSRHYTITVNNVEDESTPTPITIAPDSQIEFSAYTPRGYAANVPESTDYTLVYSIDLPTSANYTTGPVGYSTDNSATVGPFNRIAYYMELQKPGEDFQYLWVSMDAFTDQADKIGFPTFRSGAVFQQLVNNMNVFCNVGGVVTGTGITTGNIEFWPWNYSAGNAISIPGADGGTYDFGDTCSYGGNYGSMQLHNHGASQVLFAINHWNGGTLQMGIGNQASGNPDYTFNDNAGSYSIKRLQILVMCDPTIDTTAPAPVSAVAAPNGHLITVTFDDLLLADSVTKDAFALDNSVQILSADLQADKKTVELVTTAQPVGTTLTLTIEGVRNTAAIATPAGTEIEVSGIPPEIATNVGADADGYQLVYTVDIPIQGNFNTPGFYRYDQSSSLLDFDRVAYYAELEKIDGTVQYIWLSMDTFTGDLNKIGVPIASAGTVWQQTVDNLFVKSNVAGVDNGSFVSGGNLEFWASSYSETNTAAIPGASNGTFDFGDSGGSASTGHGSMQIHNYSVGKSLFCMNNWGNNGNTIAIGIGNDPNTGRDSYNPDWTHAGNAGSTYRRRLLHVLVRPTTVATLPPPAKVEANVPEAADYQLAYTIDLPAYPNFWDNGQDVYLLENNYTNGLAKSFSRIAYYLELQSGSSPTQWVWTAMDAFTSDARKIGVPTNNCAFQTTVKHLDVRSNVGGIVTGDDIQTGNIEFWPSNYGGGNSLPIPNAHNTNFDFGDGGYSSTTKGYGSMQVHNYGTTATQTLFAVNHFNGGELCIGIGNCPDPVLSNGAYGNDWTFRNNGGDFNYRRLYVFVLPGPSVEGESTGPVILHAAASRSLDQVSVIFNEELSDSSADPAYFTLNNGATVSGASLLPDKKGIVLTTSPLVAGLSYTLNVDSVCDRTLKANLILPYSAVNFTAPNSSWPDVLTNVVEASGYDLIHELAVDNNVYYKNGCNYTVDESYFARTQAFDRIAYCMELEDSVRGYHWAYVSLDAYTTDLTKIGVPTFDRGVMWQQLVSNMNVYASANVANSSVTTGTAIATGNIEFWFSNYNGNNDKNIPNATSVFDWGDGGANIATAGHGSMQIHNYQQSHTILSMTHFGSDTYTPGLGIGNDPNPTVDHPNDLDYTFHYNAGSYSTKNIYVLARPAQVSTLGTPPEIWSQPRSQTLYLDDSAHLSVYSPDAVSYQWRKNGVPMEGATDSWLDFNPPAVDDSATYDVIVWGANGYVTSETAVLEVLPYTHPQPPNTIRIMPLGDSITYGYNVAGGYRLPLYNLLVNAGYNVDFVGTQTGNSASGLGTEIQHEGHGGWTIGGLDNYIYDWFYAIDDPDVILLHIGTNDSGASDFYNRVDQLDILVTEMATNRPNANIIVTTLLPRSDTTRNTAITNLFNPYVEGKVLAQQALGRKVTFLDMYSYLTLADLADGVHPNATGYGKMADAWFPAITNVVSVYGDDSPPVLARAVAVETLEAVEAVFSKALDPETATNIANYAISDGVTISGATLSDDQRTVTLTTSTLTRNTYYTLTVNNVKDYSWPVQQTIATDSSDVFRATIRGYLANVPEASEYRLAYALDIPNSPNFDGVPVGYSVDNTAAINQPLNRIAYYLELQRLDGDLSYVWVSMDAFTDDVTKIGVPAKYTETVYQQMVENMNVLCNDPAIATGTDIATGNIEFWPFDYSGNNAISIPNAASTFDFGDTRSSGGSYGCMQIHNWDIDGAGAGTEGQTIFAFNRWNSGGPADLGIGNCPAPVSGGVDWTFSVNGNYYPVRSLYVLVTTGVDTIPPTLVSAQSENAGTMITVTFSEALLPDSVDGTCFTLDHGVTVVSARLLSNGCTVVLNTTPQPAGQTLTLTVTGVRDAGGANPIAPGSTIIVTASAPPPEIVANVGALADGFERVYTLDIPSRGNFNGTPDFYQYDLSLATGAFDRVAYYMELLTAAGTTQYVWTAMDAFTQDRRLIGVPIAARGTVWQQYVTNLDVKSNVSTITDGTGMSNGNLEFWPSNYSPANSLGIVNASSSYFDWGDSGASTSAGHGSMQVHNAGLSQVLFAMNRWGTDGRDIDLGIGNRPGTNDRDWTHAANAYSYVRRTLHVLIRPTAPSIPSNTDTTGPTLTDATASLTLDKVMLEFSETLADGAANDGSFALNNGASVLAATLSDDLKGIILETSPLTGGVSYQVTVSGVSDRTSNANLITPNSTISFTAPTTELPAVLTNVPEIGDYTLIHQLAIGSTANYSAGAPYSIDESLFAQFGPFDRIAYCMELTGTNGVYQWAYVSMDAFTLDLTRIGVPTFDRDTVWQQYVSNFVINASDNIAGTTVTTGQVAVGNIEFWPWNYGGENTLAVPGASESAFDFGDKCNYDNNYGCMQVHNFSAGETIFALNHWNSGGTVEIGIGNHPTSSNTDWTFSNSGPLYSARNLYVLVRRSTSIPTGNGPAIIIQPQSETILEGRSTYMYILAEGATAYQWRKNGEWIPGATQEWLEFTPAELTDGATYDVLVFSNDGTTLSQSATLEVIPSGTRIIIR